MMKSLKCSFDIASSGAQALEKLRTNKYDAVLMDVGLTDMNGLDVTQELRNFEKDGYTPVVALTAHAFEEDRNRCFQAGMDDYLTKPLDEEKLLLTVKRWVTRGRNFLKKE
jgi:two-component system sensor histidine kinase/response regulator